MSDPTPPVSASANGETPTPTPPEHLAPLLRNLARLRGRSRAEIRPAVEHFVAVLWRRRRSDKERQGALAWAFEQLLFDHERA